MEMPSTSAPQPRNKGGRPRKLTPHSRDIFLKALALGASDMAAAHTAGFSMDALANYKKRDKTLAEDMLRAYSQMQMRELARLEESSRLGDPNVKSRNCQWKLERHHATRGEFGRQALELSGPGGGPIRTEADNQWSLRIVEDESIRDKYYELLAAIGGTLKPPASATAQVDGASASASGASSEVPPPTAKASALLRPALPPGVEDAEKLELELWVPPDPGYEDPWVAAAESPLHPAKNVTPSAVPDDDDEGELI